MATEAAILKENERLLEIVQRQDIAIDEGLAVLTRLARTGSCPKPIREAAIKRLTEARNERIRL